MPVIDRTLWFNGLVDDDGSGTTGTVWQKSEVGKFIDSIDAALTTGQFPPTNHASRHTSGSVDTIAIDTLGAPTDITTLNVSVATHGLAPKLPGNTTTFLRGDGAYAVPPSTAPLAHATTHNTGGSDALTALSASILTTGTLADARLSANVLKFTGGYPGGAVNFLRADGTFAPPPGGTPTAHATTHASAGSDVVDVKTLGGFPGGTTTFLRADGTFVIPPGGGSGGGNVNGPATSVVGRVATWNDTTGTLLADGGVLLSALVTTTDPRLTDARTPTAHAATHASAGSDPVTIAESQVTNLVTDLAGKASTTHATTHKSGGADAIKIDELAAATDVLTLNVSTTAHGLAPKLPGNTTTFLRGDGTYAAPASGGAFTVITNTQTGTLNDWAPAGLSGNTYIDWAGTTDTVITGIAGGVSGQIVTVRNSGGKVLTFADYSSAAGAGSIATNRTNNNVKSAATPIATGGFATYQYVGGWWQLLAHDQGSWISQPYSASDFTAAAAMTWTVDAGDLKTFRYRLSGKTLFVEMVVLTTSTGGTASNALWVKIPGGFAAIGTPQQFTGSNFYLNNATPWSMGAIWLDASIGNTNISIWQNNFGGTPWVISTNNIHVYMNVVLEVN